MSYKCDSTLLRIRLYKDLLQKQYNLSDTSYEILIRSQGQDLVISDEAGWALAVLMFG